MVGYDFQDNMFKSLVGGTSAIDFPKLSIKNMSEAQDFLLAYGYNWDSTDDQAQLWALFRRAVAYISSELLNEGEKLPDEITDMGRVQDLRKLLLLASGESPLQPSACALLRVMHVIVHSENDLFTTFSSEIQEQIFKPIQSHIFSDAETGVRLGQAEDAVSVTLQRFDIKPFKNSSSAVTKLLAKPEALAFTLLDKIGVRFVTRNVYDAFCVMRYLVTKNIIAFAHVIPDQSNNTLYPINIFLEVMDSVPRHRPLNGGELDSILYDRLKRNESRAEYLEKQNAFSSSDYRFIKFITRRLIRVEQTKSGKPLTFFYPFEVQIMDHTTYTNNLSGHAAHEEYKRRQRSQARRRVFGPTEGLV